MSSPKDRKIIPKQNPKHTSIELLNNSTLQTINNRNPSINNSSQVSHSNIFGTEDIDTTLQTNTNISNRNTLSPILSLSVPSNNTNLTINDNRHNNSNNQLLHGNGDIPTEEKQRPLCSVDDVHELINIIDQNKFLATVSVLLEEIEKQKKIIIHQQKTIKNERKTTEIERNKKRELLKSLSELGLHNSYIAQCMSTFRYSADIRKFHVPEITELYIGETEYVIGQLEGEKTFHFINSTSCGTKLFRSQLEVVEVQKDNQAIKKFTRSTFKTGWCDNINNNYQHSEEIFPGEPFYVTFYHPIIQKIGPQQVCYRLFSYTKKANTRSKNNSNGIFGEKMEFIYQVKDQ